MRNFFFLLTISLQIISCGQNDNKQKELELKEKELALKEKELELKEKVTKQDTTVQLKKSQENSNHNLDGVWKNCKDEKDKLILTKNGDGYKLKGNSENEYLGLGDGIQLTKRNDGSYYDQVVGYSLKFDKNKNHLIFDIRQSDINGLILLEYCRDVSDNSNISTKSDKNLSINLEGKWKDCDGMNYGFKLIKQGENYSMQRIKGYFVPIECTFKKKADLFIGCDGDAEINYDKIKKRLVYWDAGGNGAEYCRIE